MARLSQSQVAKLRWHATSIWQVPGADARLAQLWCGDRCTGSQVAAALLREFGVELSRSAVLGRVRRLGLIGLGGRVPREKGLPAEPNGGVSLGGGCRYTARRVVWETRA